VGKLKLRFAILYRKPTNPIKDHKQKLATIFLNKFFKHDYNFKHASDEKFKKAVNLLKKLWQG
jgi:hypothetical protein